MKLRTLENHIEQLRGTKLIFEKDAELKGEVTVSHGVEGLIAKIASNRLKEKKIIAGLAAIGELYDE